MSTLHRISVLYGGLPGMPGTNTIYHHENGASAADGVNAVKGFLDDISTNLASALTYDVNPVVEQVDSTTGAVIGVDDTGGGGADTGASGSESLPFSTQLLVQLRTGVFNSGRELRGRIFIPGQVESNNDAGRPSAAWVTFAQSKVDTMLAAGGIAVYSPTHHTWASVSAGKVWNEWAVLRSRRD